MSAVNIKCFTFTEIKLGLKNNRFVSGNPTRLPKKWQRHNSFEGVFNFCLQCQAKKVYNHVFSWLKRYNSRQYLPTYLLKVVTQKDLCSMFRRWYVWCCRGSRRRMACLTVSSPFTSLVGAAVCWFFCVGFSGILGS